MGGAPSSTQTPFAQEYVDAIEGIRGALTDVLSSIGVDPSRRQEIADRLGIHSLLAWRLSKIVTTTDPATPMRQLPGGSGLKILAKAFDRAGVPPDRIEVFDEAIATFRRMAERHAGSDDMLEVMLASPQDDPAFADLALALRKQAFRGAASVWGAFARQQVMLALIAPTRGEDELVDLANLEGLVDFRLLRDDAFWPVHAGYVSTGDAAELPEPQRVPPSSLVPRFCSDPVPAFDEVEIGGRPVLVMPPGTVGKTGAVTWMLERLMPGLVSRYCDAENEFGKHTVQVQTPVELLQHDLLIHRDLPFDPPEALLFGDITGAYTQIGMAPQESCRIPMAEEVVPLRGSPPIMSSPHVPGMTEMAEYLCERVGRRPDEFRGYRFTMRYPPIPTKVVLQHPLLTRS